MYLKKRWRQGDFWNAEPSGCADITRIGDHGRVKKDSGLISWLFSGAPVLGRMLVLPLFVASACQPVNPSAGDDEPRVLVLVASSLGEIVEQAAARFEAKTGIQVLVHVAGSSTIGSQLLSGSSGDVFIPADRAWAGLVLEAFPSAIPVGEIARNRLVVVGDLGGGESIDLAATMPPTDWSKVAIADPEHVPAGRYARSAFESIGWWDPLKSRLVPTGDVRAALRLVEMGEADAGVVYQSDVFATTSVRILAVLPSSLHEPIIYPIVMLEERPAVRAFIESLGSSETRSALVQRGFTNIMAAPREGP